MISRRHLLAGATVAPSVLASLAAPGLADAAVAPPTLDEILAPPTLLGAALSPDGQQLAVLHVEHAGEKLKAYVLLQRADKPRDPPTAVLIGDYDVQQLEWANDERLLIWINVHKELDGRSTGIAAGGLIFSVPKRRILSMNLDGSESAILFGAEARLMQDALDLASVVDTLPDDPNRVLMQAWDGQKLCYALYKVDVRTGVATLFERGAPATDGWFTQNGVPIVRFDSNRRGTVVSMFTRAPGAADWTLYRKLRRDELRQISELQIVGSTPDAGVLLVAAQREGDNARALRRFDVRTLELGDPIISRPNRDINDVFVDQQSRLIAASFTEDRLDYLFFEPALKSHYDELQALFKHDTNLTFIDVSLDHRRFVLGTSSPTEPGALWFYDTGGVLTLLGQKRPWLSGRLAPMRTIKLKARDGLDLTAYLTTPIGDHTGPRPLIVFPHGGPEARDDYSYDNFVQAFAAKGWMVLQVNFRGSSGYGRAFADAGRKRWDVEMQNDVEDALAAILATGKADSSRVAICGASYGGYAALMGAVKTPAAYKAVVAIAAVTHLDDFVANARREDGADSPVYAYWVKTIGDPVADKALLARGSPALRAREIQAPVLLIHGNQDGIVPVEQSQTMSRALKNARRPVKYVELKWVGHRGWDRVTTKTILTETIAHIEKAFV